MECELPLSSVYDSRHDTATGYGMRVLRVLCEGYGAATLILEPTLSGSGVGAYSPSCVYLLSIAAKSQLWEHGLTPLQKLLNLGLNVITRCLVVLEKVHLVLAVANA